MKEQISIGPSFLNKGEAIGVKCSKLYFIHFRGDPNENLIYWFKFIVKYSYAAI